MNPSTTKKTCHNDHNVAIAGIYLYNQSGLFLNFIKQVGW